MRQGVITEYGEDTADSVVQGAGQVGVLGQSDEIIEIYVGILDGLMKQLTRRRYITGSMGWCIDYGCHRVLGFPFKGMWDKLALGGLLKGCIT